MGRLSERRRKRALIWCVVSMAVTVGIAAYTLLLSWREAERETVGSSLESVEPVESSWVSEQEELRRIDPVEVEGLDPGLPIIALTIDDSVTALTADYCRALTDNGCTATFFTVGYLAENDPETLEALAAAGMEIGNHSYSHQQLAGLSPEKIKRQVESTDQLVEELTGAAPTLMRPPYGRVNGDVLAAAGHPVVLWSLDVQDAVSTSAEEILARLLTAQDGDIVRVHDGVQATLEALEQGLPALREAGIQVTTVSNLFAVRGYAMEAGRRYRCLP